MKGTRLMLNNEAMQDEAIAHAIAILHSRMREPGRMLSSPDNTKKYLTLKLLGLEHEVFGCLFLDVKNRLIKYKELFRGTLLHTSVYPREVIKEALKYNACSVIFCHNHPSGDPTPTEADKEITKQLKRALALVDVNVVDHIIVGKHNCFAFSEYGLL